MSSNRRLQILTDEEIAGLYERPEFTDTERRHFFVMPDTALASLDLKSKNDKATSSILYFILQYGYFKARHLFFNFQYSQIKDDVRFVMKNYMPKDSVPKKLPARKSQSASKAEILKLFGFCDDLKITDDLIFNKASNALKRTGSPVDIFYEIIAALEERKIVLPPYSRLQTSIGSAIKNEDEAIVKTINQQISKKVEKSIKQLFKADNNFYNLTELKFDAKSFKTQEMTGELNKLELCQIIYDFSKKVLPKLSLSRRKVEYYSDLAKLFTVDRLKRIKKELAYLYVICYVEQRYEKVVNNLIQGFVYYVDLYASDAKKYSDNNIVEPDDPLHESKKPIGQLMQLFIDDEVMSLHGSLIREKAFNVMPRENIIEARDVLLEEKNYDDLETQLIWEYHKDNFRSILINLRPIFSKIDFELDEKKEDLMNAITYFKRIIREDKKLCDVVQSDIPINHIIPNRILQYFYEMIGSLKNEKVINTYQYEFYIYYAIRLNIKTGRAFVNNSVEYKNFDEDIKADPNWKKNKDKKLKELNNPVLLTPIEKILSDFKAQLEPLIVRTNERAMNGENKTIKIKYHRDGSVTWTLPYPKKNDEVDNPFYGNIEPITISEAYDYVEQRFGFMSGMKHVKPHRAKLKKDYLGIKGAILSNGTTQGTHQFAKRSNIKYQRLHAAEENYIRLETLRDCADIIINGLISLPIFDNYNLGGLRHGSKDGKKKKTRRRILKARHSPKYLGLDVGVVMMTMNLNNIPIVTNIIGANEHESHYSFPMLLRALSSLDLDIISTDTHGTNNVNDLLYYLKGKVHAACYRSTPDKVETISGFKKVEEYADLLINPQRQVNEQLIKDKWEDLLPILVSILSHETSQHIIVKKLSSHDYKSDIKDAFWELNNIVKSIHLLKYVDDPDYQRNIRTALNRGEGIHQLYDKITDVGAGDFRGMSELEVEIWNECTRFIALIMIAYNMCILSELYEIKLTQGDEAAIEFLKHISPIASQHINIGGLYEFSEGRTTININAVVDALNKILDDALNTI